MRKISIKSEDDSQKVTDLYAFSNELCDTFYSNSKKGSVFHVRLNSSGLALQRNTSAGSHKDHLVNICDIIGGRCVWMQKPTRFRSTVTCGVCTPSVSEKQKSHSEEHEDAYLYVFAYILKKNRNAVRRERTVITLRFRSFDSYEDNMREAEKWYKSLKSHRDRHLDLCKGYVIETNDKMLASKRLLILLNPKSGSGRARELFHQQVVPVLNEAEVAYDLYVTKHSHYARDFIRQRDLSVWSGIVAIGGDGLFHEVLNGLLKRPDWGQVVQLISLGIVPCGSGNGLARSIAHSFQEPYDPKPILGAALTLVGGYSAPMDVVEIELDNKIIYSFLSVGWGLISDIDIESERLRALGYQRFTIWTLHRLINLRTYRGKISYLPKGKVSTSFVSEFTNMQSRTTLQHSMSCHTFSSSSELRNYKSTEHVVESEFVDVVSLETFANQSFRSRCGSWLSSGSRKSTYYSIADSIYHSISGNSECNEPNIYIDDHSEDHRYISLGQSEFNSSPSLCDPLPDTWIVDEGEFVMIHAVYQSHLGSDCHFSPRSKLNDDIIYLVMIRGGISRSQLFNFLINMSSGTHLPNKNTEYIRVERVGAFRLEPHDNKGILTIDGERMECTSLQAKIFPGAVNVMVPSREAFTGNTNVTTK